MTQSYIVKDWYKIRYPELESEFIFEQMPNEKVTLKDSDILTLNKDGTFICENRLMNFPLKIDMKDVMEITDKPLTLRCCEY